jgi:predicted ArsR family transcriptional regulator
VEIMRRLLSSGTATPGDIANALGLPIGRVSYHVRFLADHRVLRLTGRTQRRGATVHHYQLSDRGRAASMLWGLRATLLVTDFEREDGRGDVTVRLDAKALDELRALTDDYLSRIGELGLQTRERRSGEEEPAGALTQVAVLLAVDETGQTMTREEAGA